MAVLEPLRERSTSRYLRFGDVYRRSTSLEDFEAAITLLRAERPATAEEPTHPDTAYTPRAAHLRGERAAYANA